jgi:ABC-type Zn uptake system ZnuABC Zn-binding protein ZnuA
VRSRRRYRHISVHGTVPSATLLLFVAVLLVGCRPQAVEGDRTPQRPVVAVTIFPVGDIVRVLAGSSADVVVILPPGASPATFEPAPDLIRRLSGAAVVIAVGAGADDWAGELARASGARFVVLTQQMPLRYGGNPHVWLDPILVRDVILPQLTDELVGVVSDEAPAIRRRATEYSTSLGALDHEIRATMSAVPSRAFVAAHSAWPYFAERYGLQQVGVLYPAPGRELSPRELGSLIDEARRAGVRAVFTEPQLGETGVKTLADELRARIGVLDPLGGPGVAGRESYEALLRFNARALADALGGAHE